MTAALKNAAGEELGDDQTGAEKGDGELEHERKVAQTEAAEHQTKDRPKEQAEPECQQAELYITVVEKLHNHFSIQDVLADFLPKTL